MVALEGGMCGCSRGVCVVALGGHVWLLRGACVVAPGVCGCCQGGCVVALRWHAWLLPGGMHGCSRGMCVVALGGACMVDLGRGVSGYHADTPITIKAEPSIWPTAALINIHEHPI